ncbi:hypothetical protein FACS1894170_11580 [Planctomycetales bacterium]|nr:hypothetical protein FACS1894170_11580 [Planctomycetales bacterium]
MTYQTNRVRLDKLVAQYNAQLYDYEEDGFLLLNDDGKYIHHLAADLSDEQIDAAEAFLNNPVPVVKSDATENPNAETGPNCDGISCSTNSRNVSEGIVKNILILEADLNLLASSDETKFLFDSILPDTETANVTLRFQFTAPPESWETLLQSFVEKTAELLKQKSLQIVLSGQFQPITENDRAFFSMHDIQLEFVHDIVAESFGFSEKTRFVVSQLADFGFRVPFVWYVNDLTVHRILPLIDEAMTLNYYSGFSLPMFQYRLDSSCSSCFLSRENYLTLLADVYAKYPYYDDRLFPLNEIFLRYSQPNRKNLMTHQVYARRSRSPVLFAEADCRLHNFFMQLFVWQRWEFFRLAAN